MVDQPEASFPSTPARTTMPEWCSQLLDAIAQRLSLGRLSATTAVNRELSATNWAIGRLILDRQNDEGWGAGVIERLSADLKDVFPGSSGFSPRNLRYKRTFAQVWPDSAILQRVAELPWRHQIVLVEKLHTTETRLWYAAAALKNGWSRNILMHQIETRLHERSGSVITNFATTLPPADSDLAQQLTKDPYVFDFPAMIERSSERELETQLVSHVQKFLLELGQGFAFVGQQVRLEIGDDEFFADLLFYHLTLRCYVVIELKAKTFDPALLGQLGIYMAAVDDLMARADNQPTIGLLLCKSKNSIVAEYALRSSSMPIDVANWKRAITDSLPEELASNLPSIETLEAELARQDNTQKPTTEGTPS